MTAISGPRGVTATGSVVIGSDRSGRPRLVHLRTQAPLGVVRSGGAVHLMGTAGGPLGGDDLSLHVRVLSGTVVTVCSVAATIALPGDGRPSHQRFMVTVEAGAALRWLPQPVVAGRGCDHHVTADVTLAGDAHLIWSDEMVLGRSGEPPGALTSTFRVTRDTQPLLHHAVSTHRPGWAGPAVTAGARAIATVLHVGASTVVLTDDTNGVQGHGTTDAGEGPFAAGCAISRLAPDVILATAVGPRHADVRRRLRAAGALPRAAEAGDR
ncbi:urease accessory protein UreD [soil metagenome]